MFLTLTAEDPDDASAEGNAAEEQEADTYQPLFGAADTAQADDDADSVQTDDGADAAGKE